MKYGTTESTFNKQKQILFITLHQQNYVIFFLECIYVYMYNMKVILVYMNQQVLKLYRKYMYACAKINVALNEIFCTISGIITVFLN